MSRYSVGGCILCEWILSLVKSATGSQELELTPLGLIPNVISNVRGISMDFLRDSSKSTSKSNRLIHSFKKNRLNTMTFDFKSNFND
jgi:hypothetical protein